MLWLGTATEFFDEVLRLEDHNDCEPNPNNRSRDQRSSRHVVASVAVEGVRARISNGFLSHVVVETCKEVEKIYVKSFIFVM